MFDQVLTAILSGCVWSGITIITLKNDFKWIRKIIDEHKEIFELHDERIRHLERKVK